MNIKIKCTKLRIKFLKECLEEKVIPRSLNWVKRVDPDSPFPSEAKLQIQKAIAEVKDELEVLFLKLRKLKRNLQSVIQDPQVWSSIQITVEEVCKYHEHKKISHFETLLINLINNSPWTKFSRTENVMNLSSVQLSRYQIEILGYGLNFALPHEKHHMLNFMDKLEQFKQNSDGIKYSFIYMNLDTVYNNLKVNFLDFLPRRFRIAINGLKNMKTINVCKADKGGKVVIIDKVDYNTKMLNLLSDDKVYRQLKKNPLSDMQKDFNSGLKNISQTNKLPFLTGYMSILPSLPYLYGLPKIHKEGMPFRPIISNINSPSYKLSKWLAKKLSPYLGTFSDAHLRHNKDLIEFLKTVNPSKHKFISFDVSALFTNVPLQPTLEFLKRKLSSTKIDPAIPTDIIIKLIELCLKKSYFQFDDVFYEQMFGIQMGNPLSPVLANLFLEHIESELLPLYSGVQPTFWKRYVDDVLCMVPHNFDLNSFLIFINGFYSTLHFTFEWEKDDRISFLYVCIHKFGD